MMLNQKELIKRKSPELLAAAAEVRLGSSSNPFNTSSLTIIPDLGRPELNRGGMPSLVNGYSSVGIDINPFDLAYRSDTKEEYLVDFGSLLVRAAWAANTGGASEGAKTVTRGVWISLTT